MKKIIIACILASLTACMFALPNLISKDQFSAASIKNIEVKVSSEDVQFKETYDASNIDVEIYCNYKKYAPDISVSGSTLYIDGDNHHRNFFTSPGGFSCTVIIYVPQKKVFKDVSLRASSGDIDISCNLSAEKEIKIESSSGEITSSTGLFADEIKVASTSGDVNLYNVDTDELSVGASSGDITIKKFTGGTSSVGSTSGEITVNEFACEYARFGSTSGSISIKKFDCDYFDAANTSGGISLELTNAPVAASSLQCSSGDIDLYVPMRDKFSVDVSCSSGTFRDKFNNNRFTPRGGYQMDYNGGGAVIKLRTSSGDVTLDY